MKPGDLLVMHYMTMWRSTTSYRGDKGDMKAVGEYLECPGYITDGKMKSSELMTLRLPQSSWWGLKATSGLSCWHNIIVTPIIGTKPSLT
jgi:hypothetical protein